MTQTEADHIATAINWAKQFPDMGIPDNITASDATIRSRRVTHQEMENTGPLIWEETEWTVIIRGRWAVDLDAGGLLQGPPRRIR
jgi:hypothetical protein